MSLALVNELTGTDAGNKRRGQGEHLVELQSYMTALLVTGTSKHLRSTRVDNRFSCSNTGWAAMSRNRLLQSVTLRRLLTKSPFGVL